MDKLRVAVVYTMPSSHEERGALDEIVGALKNEKLRFLQIERRSLKSNSLKGANLVITIGGDGTFLLAAHYLEKKAILLGVNSDRLTKEGFLLRHNRKNFSSSLKKLMKGEGIIRDLPTLEVKVNGKLLPFFALNEFFVGSSKAYRTSRYQIKLRGRKETHRSSGVICATSVGAHAWASSAIGSSISIPDDRMVYVVREPYERKVFSDYHLKRGVLRKGESLTIINKMEDGVLVSDSLGEEYPLKHGDVISITLSKRTIKSLDSK